MLILAVVFGALGDLILEYDWGGDNYFQIGASSFLIGHIFYNIAITYCWKYAELKVLY